MPRQRRMPGHWRQVALAAAFVGHLVLLANAQREGRVVVEEERSDVVVVDEEQHIGLALGNPLLHRLEGLEDGRPDRVVLLVAVEGETDGRRVGCGDGANDFCHACL